MKNPNLTERHLLTNKVDVDLDVLRAAMLNRVAGHIDSTDVIAEDNSRGRERTMKLEKKLTKPAALSHGMSHGSVLRLGTGTGHSSLTFRRPRDKVVTKIDAVAGRRTLGVRAPSPICVRVCSKCHGGGAREVQVEV